jgi:hypothetical protein
MSELPHMDQNNSMDAHAQLKAFDRQMSNIQHSGNIQQNFSSSGTPQTNYPYYHHIVTWRQK